jgi:hypothetical protein
MPSLGIKWIERIITKRAVKSVRLFREDAEKPLGRMGNSWLFQETTTRLRGTIEARTTTCESVKIWLVRCTVQRPQRVKMKRRSGKPTKDSPELVRLVHDHGTGRPGSANISSPTDSWEESNHAF